MYYYNKRFAKITDSETLKATAADCISDSIATLSVLISTVVSHITHFKIDGYCGVMVSIFILFADIRSLWEVLGRIMGKAADADTKDTILQVIKVYQKIISVRNFMLHDEHLTHTIMKQINSVLKNTVMKLKLTISD